MQQDLQNTEAEESPAILDSEALMTPAQRRFYTSEQCSEAREALQRLVDNPAYNTDSTYFSGNELAFVDRHLYYLSTHASVNLEGYISNLRLMTRI